MSRKLVSCYILCYVGDLYKMWTILIDKPFFCRTYNRKKCSHISNITNLFYKFKIAGFRFLTHLQLQGFKIVCVLLCCYILSFVIFCCTFSWMVILNISFHMVINNKCILSIQVISRTIVFLFLCFLHLWKTPCFLENNFKPGGGPQEVTNRWKWVSYSHLFH